MLEKFNKESSQAEVEGPAKEVTKDGKAAPKRKKKTRSYVHKRRPLNCDFYKKMHDYFLQGTGQGKGKGSSKRNIGHLRCKISKFFTDPSKARPKSIRWKNGLVLYEDILEVYDENPKNFDTSGMDEKVLGPFVRDERAIEAQLTRHFGMKLRSQKLKPLNNVMLNKIDWKALVTKNYPLMQQFIKEMEHEKEIFRRGSQYKKENAKNKARVSQFIALMKYFIEKNERVLLYASTQYYLEMEIKDGKGEYKDDPAMSKKLHKYFTSKMTDGDRIKKSLGVVTEKRKRVPVVRREESSGLGVSDLTTRIKRDDRGRAVTTAQLAGVRKTDIGAFNIPGQKPGKAARSERLKKGISDFDAFTPSAVTPVPARPLKIPKESTSGKPGDQKTGQGLASGISAFYDFSISENPMFSSKLNISRVTGFDSSFKLPQSNQKFIPVDDDAVVDQKSDKTSSRYSIYDDSRKKAGESVKSGEKANPPSSDNSKEFKIDRLVREKAHPGITEFNSVGEVINVESFGAISQAPPSNLSKVYSFGRIINECLNNPRSDPKIRSFGRTIDPKLDFPDKRLD